MSKAATRIVSALILSLWMSPSAGALAVGLHLALDHHGPHGGAEHALEIADLAQAAAHGHHHDPGAAADHDHDARIDGPVLTLRPNASGIAFQPASTSPEVGLTERAFVHDSPRRGPPLPLFTAHCSLLL